MYQPAKASVLAILIMGCILLAQAHGQAVPTASAGIHFSAFAGVTGNYTGISLGRNLSITAGGDATFRSFFGLYPSLEVRGTYPVDSGHVDGQKNVVGGLVLSRHLDRLQPYGDILFGRGEIRYTPPLPDRGYTALYVQSVSNVISPGAGCDVLLTPHFGFKGDFQLQRYDSPVTTTGTAYSKAFTAGVVYQIGLGGLGRGRHF